MASLSELGSNVGCVLASEDRYSGDRLFLLSKAVRHASCAVSDVYVRPGKPVVVLYGGRLHGFPALGVVSQDEFEWRARLLSPLDLALLSGGRAATIRFGLDAILPCPLFWFCRSPFAPEIEAWMARAGFGSAQHLRLSLSARF